MSLQEKLGTFYESYIDLKDEYEYSYEWFYNENINYLYFKSNYGGISEPTCITPSDFKINENIQDPYTQKFNLLGFGGTKNPSGRYGLANRHILYGWTSSNFLKTTHDIFYNNSMISWTEKTKITEANLNKWHFFDFSNYNIDYSYNDLINHSFSIAGTYVCISINFINDTKSYSTHVNAWRNTNIINYGYTDIIDIYVGIKDCKTSNDICNAIMDSLISSTYVKNQTDLSFGIPNVSNDIYTHKEGIIVWSRGAPNVAKGSTFKINRFLNKKNEFEYLVQYTHNFVEITKDNYLQGLGNNGPNTWLNFDNAGTQNYGNVYQQDIQQRWTNEIFNYKTQNYFEHPLANCTIIQPMKAGHFAGCRISFRGMGPNTFYGEQCTFTKDDLNLLGFGVTTKFNGVMWTYAFYFVNDSSTVTITQDNDNHTIQILTGLDGCDNGKILCERIVKALCESSIIKNDSILKEVFAHPSVNPYNVDNPWAIGQDEIIFWNSEHYGVASGFDPRTLKKALKINAEYNGPIINDGNNYDKNDISVTITYEIPGNSKTKTINLKQEEFTVDSTLVLKENAIGNIVCEFTVSYEEQLYGQTSPTIFTDTIQVPILYFKEFKAEYIGPDIYIVSDYDINDVIVSLAYNIPEYNKILDQSEYDLSTTTIDKLGVNTITVTEQSENHYQTTFIVIGIRIVLDISAKYIGPPIEVTDQYNPLDVIVSLDTVDNNHENRMTIILKYAPDMIELIPGIQFTNEYLIKEPGLLITNVGDNVRTVFYKDQAIETTTEFIVPGIPKLVDFETTYIGDTRIIGEHINKSEVLAISSCIIDKDYTLETKILEDNEWEFYDAPIITDANKGYIRIQYKNLMSSIKVKYDIPKTLRLRCWYEGAKIEVGNTYEYENVPTYLVFPNGDLKRLRVLDLEFSSNYVAEKGWNWYTVTYRTDYYVLSGIFAVPGYIPITYPNVDFMVKYIDIPNNYREIDYTESFRPKFTFDGVFIITWQQFLVEVNELMLYGLYILTAPKFCGLSNKYGQDWEVLCINKTTLKANIMKTYLKEEDLPWQEQNQLKQ